MTLGPQNEPQFELVTEEAQEPQVPQIAPVRDDERAPEDDEDAGDRR